VYVAGSPPALLVGIAVEFVNQMSPPLSAAVHDVPVPVTAAEPCVKATEEFEVAHDPEDPNHWYQPPSGKREGVHTLVNALLIKVLQVDFHVASVSYRAQYAISASS